jgi:hypothetical protein
MSIIDKASWLTSFFIAGAVYYILSKIFPPNSTFVGKTVESLDEDTEDYQGHSNGLTGGTGDILGWEKEKVGSSGETSPTGGRFVGERNHAV